MGELFKENADCGFRNADWKKRVASAFTAGEQLSFTAFTAPARYPAALLTTRLLQSDIWFYEAYSIAYSLRQAKHHAQRGVDEALSDGSAARHCNNIRPRNSLGAITQRGDQGPGCSPVGSFPSGSA